ncbi:MULTISPECIES: Rrf2 family transcriptional regulator [unclassified Enterococcus]|uniref:RrF2 family transcriptional regulator n=1 Tax=unclassified Enterococcus TaxID=2608891 RepID=UPI00155705D6|nr:MULTISPECIES: Rrf2 family transcriptional regulator [unclassified Enterococcus]MBS7576382.1 Rrf2 family transcriptional regulator [Enterococcus sp. MMGLQ5-2]MBS7583614.1 Rrf2 family transcriptional regulator [Enterococcus sp. MMGLQ5-1]NPD11475.1 Rrf2 family transcriptional regulator [Enterococcus sp. MMGLQ5-1]NPD36219.1 Rrf2 family transcriptional regulator [Enterococcus sp. MMGLQ5-2]
MKLKKSFEQAVCVILMLALEKDNRPIKNAILSRRLQVSDSYLKKIMRKMVVEGIIISDASKDGGFRLAKSLDLITMLDVYYAIEGHEDFVEIAHYANRVFDNSYKSYIKNELAADIPSFEDKILTTENSILQVIFDGQKEFLDRLKNYPLSNILRDVNCKNGLVEWELIRNKEL